LERVDKGKGRAFEAVPVPSLERRITDPAMAIIKIQKKKNLNRDTQNTQHSQYSQDSIPPISGLAGPSNPTSSSMGREPISPASAGSIYSLDQDFQPSQLFYHTPLQSPGSSPGEYSVLGNVSQGTSRGDWDLFRRSISTKSKSSRATHSRPNSYNRRPISRERSPDVIRYVPEEEEENQEEEEKREKVLKSLSRLQRDAGIDPDVERLADVNEDWESDYGGMRLSTQTVSVRDEEEATAGGISGEGGKLPKDVQEKSVWWEGKGGLF